jgi:hypothetical protein
MPSLDTALVACIQSILKDIDTKEAIPVNTQTPRNPCSFPRTTTSLRIYPGRHFLRPDFGRTVGLGFAFAFNSCPVAYLGLDRGWGDPDLWFSFLQHEYVPIVKYD